MSYEFKPDALYLAVQIQLNFDPKQWARELDRLDPGPIQDAAREYLRGIWIRMRNIAKNKAAKSDAVGN